MAADMAIATMSRICTKPKLTPAAKKTANISKITIATGIMEECRVIGSHLSENTVQPKYIPVGCTGGLPTLRHSAAFGRMGLRS